MKITLIKPNIGRILNGSYVDEGRMQPLQLGILAALTPEDIEVVMYDDRMEEIPYDEKTDLVAITVETFTAKRSYEISAEFKKRNIPVIMGGMHATLIPEEVQEHADSILIGDAENIWFEIIEDFKNNQLKKRYLGKFGEPQKNIFPRREIFNKKGYLPISLMQFSRGCRYNCSYCASSVYFNRTNYCRNVENVVKEIQDQNLKLIFFVDDNIISNREKSKELFKALIPLKIKWVSQASIDMTEDRELMKLMSKSGCLGNVIGFESLEINNLKSMGKLHNIKENKKPYYEQIQILRDYGQQTWAAFTLGHEFDTIESIEKIEEFSIENKFAFAAFNVLLPYPNTQFFNKLLNENRLLYDGKWWLHDDYRFNNAAFSPKNITPEQLSEAAFKARKKFNSIFSIFKRSLDLKTHMRNPIRFLIYLQYNPLIRKEVFKKQGMIFGKN